MSVVMRACTLFLIAALAARATPQQNRAAIRGLEEFAKVCRPEGLRLWGRSLCGPMVLVDPGTRAAIANQPDPDGKFRREGDVYVGAFPDQYTPSNTAFDWKGQQWSTVMLPLPLDPYSRLSLLAHESFHRIQPA